MNLRNAARITVTGVVVTALFALATPTPASAEEAAPAPSTFTTSVEAVNCQVTFNAGVGTFDLIFFSAAAQIDVTCPATMTGIVTSAAIWVDTGVVPGDADADACTSCSSRTSRAETAGILVITCFQAVGTALIPTATEPVRFATKICPVN